MSNQPTGNNGMNNNGTLNAETQRKSPQGKILQPKLRFKGFADPWQQRKLGELAEFSKGAGFSKSDLCEHGRGIILYGQMYTNYQLVIDCISTHVPMNSHGVESRRNDIIVPASGETPEDIAIASVVKLNGVLLGGDINVIRLHGNQTDATFIALLLSHGSLHKTLASRAQGKSIVHLHISDIANLHVLKPGITEQSRIAEFFRVLDDRIAAAKKKADLLKLKKKYYLQAIFSRRLRFKGFTEPWQQRKLEELCIRVGSGGTPSGQHPEYYNGKIPFLGISDLSGRTVSATQKKITQKGLDNSAAWLVPKGSITLAMYASVGKVAILGIELATSQAFFNMVIPEETCIRDFLFSRLEKADICHEWLPLISTGTQPNLNAAKLKDWELKVPSEYS